VIRQLRMLGIVALSRDTMLRPAPVGRRSSARGHHKEQAREKGRASGHTCAAADNRKEQRAKEMEQNHQEPVWRGNYIGNSGPSNPFLYNYKTRRCFWRKGKVQDRAKVEERETGRRTVRAPGRHPHQHHRSIHTDTPRRRFQESLYIELYRESLPKPVSGCVGVSGMQGGLKKKTLLGGCPTASYLSERNWPAIVYSTSTHPDASTAKAWGCHH